MYQHILLPTDGSPLSTQALAQGLALARHLDAQVTILAVVEPFFVFSASPEHIGETREAYERHARTQAQQLLHDAQAQADALGVRAQIKLTGSAHPDQAIIDAATQTGADLIAMASHGRRGVQSLLLGSVTQRVLTHCSVPVLVFRPGT